MVAADSRVENHSLMDISGYQRCECLVVVSQQTHKLWPAVAHAAVRKHRTGLNARLHVLPGTLTPEKLYYSSDLGPGSSGNTCSGSSAGDRGENSAQSTTKVATDIHSNNITYSSSLTHNRLNNEEASFQSGDTAAGSVLPSAVSLPSKRAKLGETVATGSACNVSGRRQTTGVCETTAFEVPSNSIYDGDAAAPFMRELYRVWPRYLIVIANSDNECGRDVIAALHKAVRSLDISTPYADVLHGIITGATQDDALAMINETAEPLAVKRVVSGSRDGFPESKVRESLRFSEFVEPGESRLPKIYAKGLKYDLNADKIHNRDDEKTLQLPLVKDGANGSIDNKNVFTADGERRLRMLVSHFVHKDTDMLVTSGHARETEWMPGYNYDGGKLMVAGSGPNLRITVQPPPSSSSGDATIANFDIPPSATHVYQENEATAVAVCPCEHIDYTHAEEVRVSSKRQPSQTTTLSPSSPIPCTTNMHTDRLLLRRPRIWSAAGNCLAAHINSPGCLALAFMRCFNVRAMLGYTVPTWYGYVGWGAQRYYFCNPGQLTFHQAYTASVHALLLRRHVIALHDATAAATRAAAVQRVAVASANTTKTAATVSNIGHNSKEVVAVMATESATLDHFSDIEEAYARGGKGMGRNAAIDPMGAEEHERRGLAFDCNHTAFYGDPIWDVRLADTHIDGSPYYTLAMTAVSKAEAKGVDHAESETSGSDKIRTTSECGSSKQRGHENTCPVLHYYYVLRLSTLRDGCWTPTCADDKHTEPGRPPFVALPPGLPIMCGGGNPIRCIATGSFKPFDTTASSCLTVKSLGPEESLKQGDIDSGFSSDPSPQLYAQMPVVAITRNMASIWLEGNFKAGSTLDVYLSVRAREPITPPKAQM